MRLARLLLMLFLVAGWAAAQCGGQATAADDKGKKDSAAAEHKDGEHKEMSCGCCKNMGKKDADAKDGMKADNKDASKTNDQGAAKSEAKSEGGMMAGGMGCCGAGKKDGAGMKCGGGSDSKSETPEQKMK